MRSTATTHPDARVPLVVGAIAYVVVVVLGMGLWSYDVWAALVVGPALTSLTFLLARRIAVRTGDPWVVRLLMLGWGVKVVGALVRWWTAFELYDKADARTYDIAGRAVGDLLRNGIFDFGSADLRGGTTRVIEVASGAVYAVTGPSSIAGFLVFAWAAFLGAVLLWRAFVLAVPDGLHRRYGLLLFLLPSIAYWPSSLGKDAWMFLAVGIAAYGAARLLMHRRGGVVLLAAGCGLGSMVRPHVVLVLGVAAAVAWLLGRPPRRRAGGPLLKVIGAVVVVAGCFVLFARVQEEYGLSEDGGVDSILDFTETQTEQGSSEFTAARVRTPVDLPWAAITVLVRPFPHEADNAQALVSAAEGFGIALLLLVSWQRVVGAVAAFRRTPYMLLCITFAVGFVVAFSTVGNFGILARQRVQALPFVLALVCVPKYVFRRTPPVTATRRERGPLARTGGH